MKKKILWKKAYMDKNGMTHIPIKEKGKKKYKCDNCGKKVREIFTINPNALIIRRELCRDCYCRTPESLANLLNDLTIECEAIRSKEIVDNDLTRKESKPYLCQICKLNETCQNNFDYECIEASDFLFNINTIFTVKDDFLDSLIDKNNKALRG